MKRVCLLLLLTTTLLFSSQPSIYFSPRDNLQDRLIELIDGEEASIKVAMYTFSNKRIANALARAKERGVKVTLLCDPYSIRKGWPAETLAEKGVKVYQFDKGEEGGPSQPLMHHKFCLFEKNARGGKVVWTGSYNFTYKANRKNRENAVVLSDERSYNLFNEEFEKLRTTHVIK